METLPRSSLTDVPSIALLCETFGSHTSFAVVTYAGADVTVERGVQVGPADVMFRRKVTLQAVEAGVALAAEVGEEVSLFIYARKARKELQELGTRFGPVTLASRSEADPNYFSYQPLLEDMRAVARNMTVSAATVRATAAPTKPQVLAASDGGYDAEHGGGSYGWVTEHGEHGEGQLKDARSPLEAELYAIYKLVTGVRRGSRLRIVVDSRRAIKAVEAVRDPRSNYGTARTWMLASKIVNQVNCTDFVLEWVKGHAGDPLNDAADRLARLGRQAAVFQTPSSAVDMIASSIVSDGLAALAVAHSR